MRPAPERRPVELHQQLRFAFAAGFLPSSADLELTALAVLGFTYHKEIRAVRLLDRRRAKGNDTAAPFAAEDAALVAAALFIEFSNHHRGSPSFQRSFDSCQFFYKAIC